jgi:hypothetical protein
VSNTFARAAIIPFGDTPHSHSEADALENKRPNLPKDG